MAPFFILFSFFAEAATICKPFTMKKRKQING